MRRRNDFFFARRDDGICEDLLRAVLFVASFHDDARTRERMTIFRGCTYTYTQAASIYATGRSSLAQVAL